MKKNESGRSMVEMLGVLAIIGVLSVGGIAGYTMAMKKYRANEAAQAITLAAVECVAYNNKAADSKYVQFTACDQAGKKVTYTLKDVTSTDVCALLDGANAGACTETTYTLS